MTGTVRSVLAAIGPAGLEVVRAWPRTPDHLLLDLRTPAGDRVAGQWFRDPARAAHVEQRTAAASHRDDVRRVPGSGVVLQDRGADRRLVALRDVLGRTGAALVTHRPERRAVVRHDDPTAGAVYTKVVRPGHVPRPGPRCAGLRRVRVPEVLEVDDAAGRVTSRALPGATLHHLLGADGVDEAGLHRWGRACGAALAELHARAVPQDEPVHGTAEEVAVTDRWIGAAAAHDVLPADVLEHLRRRRDRVVAGAGPASGHPVVLHRDLHDQQLLLEPASGAGRAPVGLLDFDLAAVGDPALDLANLLVHLDLRVLQGLTTAGRASACADGVLEGYRPAAAVVDALPVHAELTRLRLVSLYAFRPGYRDRVVGLLDGPAAG